MEYTIDSSHTKEIDRRNFLIGAATTAAPIFLPNISMGRGTKSPIDKMNIACVGLGSMGYTTLENCIGTKNLGNPRLDFPENVVALCDVDWKRASVPFKRFPKAKRFKDYRRMLDKVEEIDAVIVATP